MPLRLQDLADPIVLYCDSRPAAPTESVSANGTFERIGRFTSANSSLTSNDPLEIEDWALSIRAPACARSDGTSRLLSRRYSAPAAKPTGPPGSLKKPPVS